MPFLTALRDAAALLTTAVVLIRLPYEVRANWGLEADRRRELEVARSRLAALESRSRIWEVSLEGEALARARLAVLEAEATIVGETNENLASLGSWNRKALPVVGVTRWRRALLAYGPVGGWRHCGSRVVYWLWLAALTLLVGAFARVAGLYLKEGPDGRARTRMQLFHTQTGRSLVGLVLIFLVFTLEAWLFWWLARRERPVRRLHEPQPFVGCAAGAVDLDQHIDRCSFTR